jgi:3-oxoadipate enol-lactonase / 4-carboxymuconolactone decarboxylase
VTIPMISGVQLSEPGAGPLLVLGPSLGTSATALWSPVAALLADRFHVVAWDLPGHGRTTAVGVGFTLGELAAGVLRLVEAVLAERGEPGGTFGYAGDSVGGAVGLQLLLDHPDRVSGAVLLCTGAKIGEPEGWHERAATVRASGTPVMVTGSAERWFAAGFLAAHADVATGLLQALQHADREGYAQVCEALAGFDVRARLAEVGAPVLAVAGAEDVATPPDLLAEIASGVRRGRLVVLDGVAHLAPAEAPDEVARLIGEHLVGEHPSGERPSGKASEARSRTLQETYDAGLAVRREVLGDAHVDRAAAAITGFTREFQELITQYAWGTIWTRPGLDRRSRSLITLTALVARGHHEELAMHVRAALTNGLSRDEIKELLLQCAIYCGVPDANTAFRIAQQVFADLDA